MNTAVPNALNGTAPERTPTVNVTQVVITGIGTPVSDAFVVDRGDFGDPISGGNAVTLTQTPLAGAPFQVFRGGLRQVLNRDFVLNATTIMLLGGVTFATGDTIVVDYFKASA